HGRGTVRPLILGGKALPVRLSAITRIDEAEAWDQALTHRAFWNLIGRSPVGPIPHAGHREAVAIVAAAVPQDPIHLSIIVRPYPGAVVVLQVERTEQISATDAWRGGAEQPSPFVGARADVEDG